MMGICFFFAIFAERMFGKNSWVAVSYDKHSEELEDKIGRAHV